MNNPPTAIANPAPPPAPTLVDITNDAGPDPEKTVLNLSQLRDAILDEGGLTQEDLDSLKLVTSLNLHGVVFQVGGHIPETENKQYIFQIFVGDQYDDGSEHVVGDARIYVIPSTASDPRQKDWLLYTFNRTAPSYIVERMTQSVFVEEVGGEWVALNNRIAARSEAEEPGATE